MSSAGEVCFYRSRFVNFSGGAAESSGQGRLSGFFVALTTNCD